MYLSTKSASDCGVVRSQSEHHASMHRNLLSFAVTRVHLIVRPFAFASAFRAYVCVRTLCDFVVSRVTLVHFVSVWGMTLPFLQRDVSDLPVSTFVVPYFRARQAICDRAVRASAFAFC